MAGMQAQGERLASLRPLTGSDELLFTTTLDTEVTRLFITNVDASDADMRLHHVAAGDAVSQDNALYYDFTVATGTTLQIFADAPNSGIQLKEGDALWVRSSTGGRLAFNMYGVTASQYPGAGLGT